ncbi:acetyltransferase, GNAT family protein [Shewanella benthica KT99]|uniref:Acetyltransferase, GNAT family protein n=1 Tax=Shewanella benthica KT99 TaxID=314608 RepID=A9DI99_9GAMM|nr:acetyltransferase, GNAT family protein [Shewanella benthica KT99]
MAKYITEFKKVALGYRYLPEYWGQGYGSEAGKSALASFPDFGVHKAIALILLGNKGPENLVEKLVMEQRTRDRFMGHKVNVFHRYL